MENKAHIKVDKIIKYCSECPFCNIMCIGYGKSNCYEYELTCGVNDKINKPITHIGLRYIEIFALFEDLDKAKDFVPDDCPMKI